MSVSVKNNNVEFAIKRFRTQVARDGILSKARERADGYKKPGVRRREKRRRGNEGRRKEKEYY